MIEVVGTMWSPKASYDIDGSWDVDSDGVLWIKGEMDDRARRRIIATHAAKTWSSVRRVEKETA